MTRIRWQPTLEHGAEIVRSYDTGVTLRQLFYRLVADGSLPNLDSYYRRLSGQSAEARRQGWFPDLLDHTSRIERHMSFTGPEDARDWLRNIYRRDRTAGQPWTIVLGVEKAGMSEQLDAWFTDPLGIPHVALGGYASQTLCDEVRRYVLMRERPAALVYAGDLDPTGIDIDRDFERRVVFDRVIRVALEPDQTAGLPLNSDPEVVKKLEKDPRARRFKELIADEHFGGELVQYEIDALPPDELRNMYRTALDGFWDYDAYQAVLADEESDLRELDR